MAVLVVLASTVISLNEVFAAIGTPSRPPKPCGKSPGWPAGKARLRRIRFPTVKNSTNKPKKEQPQSA